MYITRLFRTIMLHDNWIVDPSISLQMFLNPSKQNEHHVDLPDRVMILMRGLPGSGKSTLARVLGNNSDCIYSTDDYFMQNGKYVFVPSMLSQAHIWNQSRVLRACQRKTSLIIVDNTHVMRWEMMYYVELAVNFGYTLQLRIPDTSWAFNAVELARRNTHNVKISAIRNMMKKFQHGLTADTLISKFLNKFEPLQIPSHFNRQPVLDNGDDDIVFVEPDDILYIKSTNDWVLSETSNLSAHSREFIPSNLQIKDASVQVTTEDFLEPQRSGFLRIVRPNCNYKATIDSPVKAKYSHFNKSCMVCESDLKNDFDSDILDLQKAFPNIESALIEEMYLNCDCNVEWATEILHEISETSCSQPLESSNDHVTSTSAITDTGMEVDVPCQSNSEYMESFETSLTLSESFASELFNRFGSFDSADESIVLKRPHIKLTLTEAEILYDAWRRTAELPDIVCLDSSTPCESKKRKTQSETVDITESIFSPKSPTISSSRKDDLVVIMEEEQRAYESEQRQINNEPTTAMLTSLAMLQEQLPHVDRDMLKHILDINAGDFEQARSCAFSQFGLPPSKVSAAQDPVSTLDLDQPMSISYQNVASPGFEDYKREEFLFTQLYKDYLQKATNASSQNKGNLVAHYSEQARRFRKQMEDARGRAAKAMLIKNNSRFSENNTEDTMLDLHGLLPDQAIEVLDERISVLKALELPPASVDVITGWGRHSRGGAKIKPAIIRYLMNNHIKYKIVNSGCVSVKLK